MDYKFEVKNTQSKDALLIRISSSMTNLKKDLDWAYRELLAYLASNNEFPNGCPFVIYHNMALENLDIEVGFPINRKFLGNSSVHMGHTPGGSVLSCTHVGSYDTLGDTYKELEKHLVSNSLTPSGEAYEIYLNNPADTPVNDLLTEVGFILRE